MRCKKHPIDLSSGVGVCASCLRERLFAIIAAQAQKLAQLQQSEAQDGRRKFDTQPAPLAFPRSVSPYIPRRKSNTASMWYMSYSSPQVAPASSITVEVKKKSSGGRFSSLFSGLFRKKLKKPDLDSVPMSDPGVPGIAQVVNPQGSCSATPSWFSTILPARQKTQIHTFSIDKNVIRGHRRNCRTRDRGMSPTMYSDEEDDEHFHGGSSGYSSESSHGWKQTPRRTPAMRHSGGMSVQSRSVSALAFCLSPLVRASPNRNWNQKGVPPEMVVAAACGDFRVPPKPHISNASSFGKNRSRKLSDFGRYNRNP